MILMLGFMLNLFFKAKEKGKVAIVEETVQQRYNKY